MLHQKCRRLATLARADKEISARKTMLTSERDIDRPASVRASGGVL